MFPQLVPEREDCVCEMYVRTDGQRSAAEYSVHSCGQRFTVFYNEIKQIHTEV